MELELLKNVTNSIYIIAQNSHYIAEIAENSKLIAVNTETIDNSVQKYVDSLPNAYLIAVFAAFITVLFTLGCLYPGKVCSCVKTICRCVKAVLKIRRKFRGYNISTSRHQSFWTVEGTLPEQRFRFYP